MIMFLLKTENVKVELNGNLLFENVSIEIKDKERVAIIGENGVGKTTFLKAIFDEIPIVSGKIFFGIHRDEISWMKQDNENISNFTVREWVESSNQLISQFKKQLQQYTNLLATNQHDEKIIREYQQVLQKYIDYNGYEWESEVERALTQVGISQHYWDLPCSSLSGGQKTKVKLAKIMMGSPKLLILDEPTNHLDYETVQWLKDWLIRFKGSVLFISHEREFIDQVATVTYELTQKGTKKYLGGYSAYKKLKEHEIKTLQTLYEKQERERKKLIDMINIYKRWYQKANAKASVRNPFEQKKAAKQAAKVKAKEKALERLEKERMEKPKDQKSIHADFQGSHFTARKMLEVSKVRFSYGSRQLFENVSFIMNRGDRFAVIGKNGSGKTTLLKLISGEYKPNSGVITHNPQLKIGYFFQELENLHPENTVLDELLSMDTLSLSEARTILACFLFEKDHVYKKVKQLSMGEKCRLAFVKLYFSQANLLILDEPTNYLDIPTREKIEEALINYEGSVIVVSHDPYFLRKISNKVLVIHNKKVEFYNGGYNEWEEHTTVSFDKQGIQNEIDRLEWQLLHLLTEETEEMEEDHLRLTNIKMLKEQIETLRKKLTQ